MTKFLFLIQHGFLDMADAYLFPRVYLSERVDGFSEDMENLRGDIERFGGVLRDVTDKKRGEQPYESTCGV